MRFLETMNRVAEILCAALMVLLSLETVYVIVMRYVFNNAPYWGEVISRFLMVYACMFGFSMGANFFLQIAKLRALRPLWAQIVEAFGGSKDAEAERKEKE